MVNFYVSLTTQLNSVPVAVGEIPDDGHGTLRPPSVGVDKVGPLLVVVHRHGELVAAGAGVDGEVAAVDAIAYK